MAQAIFEAIAAGMDSQTAMAVQSLLESQNVPEQQTQAVADDEDVFQCGKCKKQFTSLASFVTHKQSRCVGPVVQIQASAGSATVTLNTQPVTTLAASMLQNISRQVASEQQAQPSAQVVTYSTVPVSPLNAQNMVLTDDLMTFSINNVDQATLQHVQVPSPFLSQVAPLAARSNAGVVTFASTTAGTFTTNALTTALSSALQLQQPGLLQPGIVSSQTVITSPSEKATHAVTLKTENGVKTGDGSTIIAGVAELETEVDNQQQQQQQQVVKTLATSVEQSASQFEDSAAQSLKKKLTCQYCNKSFSKNFDLQQHVRSHTGEKPFQCIVCGRAFAQKSNVKKHMQTHKVWPTGTAATLPEQPLPQVVESIGESEPGKTVHIQHVGPTKGDKASLEVCEEIVASASVSGDDKSEVNIVIDNSYLCQYCPEKFKTYFLLKSHMTTHKQEQVYKCILKTCGETFHELDSFLEHTKTHEDQMSYRCHMCNKTFPSLYQLGVHQYTHSLYPNQGPKPGARHFRCTKCNNKYATPEALEHHMQTTNHTYLCPHCEKIFTCERYLRRHLPTHGTIGEFPCEVCSKRFKTEHYLKMHMLIHSGEKPFKCETCNAAFNRKDKLKRHILIHDATKKYKCPFRGHTGCMREFNRPDKLKSHIISHSGIKPFKCDICGRAFSRKAHLTVHARAHADDYSHRCNQCKRGFTREKLLREHKCWGATEPVNRSQPEMFRRRKQTRKVGRPRKRMITVTEEILKERNSRRLIGRRLRDGRTDKDKKAVVTTASTAATTTGTTAVSSESVVVPSEQPSVTQSNSINNVISTNIVTSNMSSVAAGETLITHNGQIMRFSDLAQGQVVSVSDATLLPSLTGEQIGPGGDMTAQVITIQPADFGAEGLQGAHVTDGQIEAISTADMSQLGHATLIATGPNTATLVVNPASGTAELIPSDQLQVPVSGTQTYQVAVPSTMGQAFITAENLDGYQTVDGTMFQTADGLIHTNDILQTSEQ